MDTITYFVLVPMVYFAWVVFVLGTMARLFKLWRTEPHQTTLQIYPAAKHRWLAALYDTFMFPTVRRHNPVLWAVLLIFHLCLLVVVLGHLELIVEVPVLASIPHEAFLGGGYVGLLLGLSLLIFLCRRLVSPTRELSVPEDYYLLILLFLAVLFGSQMDWARRLYGYSELGVEDYREYLRSLLMLRPSLPDNILWSGHSFMLVLHVFFGNLFLIFFPFSKIMHAFIALPLNKLRRG